MNSDHNNKILHSLKSFDAEKVAEKVMIPKTSQ